MKLSGKLFLFVMGAVVLGGIFAALSSEYLSNKIAQKRMQKAAA